MVPSRESDVRLGGSDEPRSRGLAPTLLFFLVIGVYLPSVGGGFVYDDYALILGQPAPRGPSDFLKLFTEREVAGSLPYYRPLPRLTVVAGQFLHGNYAAAFHGFNVLP